MGFKVAEIRQQWNKLTWWDVFKISMDETVLMTQYSMLPALVCTINAICGFDNLILLWILSIVVAYIIHKQQLESETASGVFSAVALTRYTTFFLIVVKCSYWSTFLHVPHEYQDMKEIPYRFLGCHVKVMANVALYRFYLTFCGIVKKVAKNKLENLQKNSAGTSSSQKNSEGNEKKCQ